MFDFKDKVVVVTGSSNGIGEAVLRKFAQSGATVILNYRSDTEKALKIQEECALAGQKVVLKQGSVSDEVFVKNMMTEIANEFGKIDILINNAGITKDGFLMTSKITDIESVLDTNLKGVLLCCKYVIPHMVKEKRGKIINISSVSALKGSSTQSVYSATKAGIIGVTQSLAVELSKFNIDVNAVAPGFIETKMTNKLSSRLKEKYVSQIPKGRFGSCEEVANVVQFLSSDLASYIVGQTISIDGGLTC